MPAIQLARLRQQSAALAEYFSNPAAFVRSLHDMLDFYADRTHRPGQAGKPRPLIQAYNVPKPILRQITNELASLAGREASQTRQVCGLLWEEAYLECRILAASLLGMAPPQPPEAVVQLVTDWAVHGIEDRLLEAAVRTGLARLREELPASYLQAVETWLGAPQQPLQTLGLKAMLLLAEGRQFENYPVYFRALTPFIRSSPSQLHPYLLDIFREFARRSPNETAYYLRQNLDAAGVPGAAWLTRRLLPDFPLETRASLRAAMRNP